jgi:hypothetical protein
VSSFCAVLAEVKAMLVDGVRRLNKTTDEVYRMFACWDIQGRGNVTSTQFLRVLARLQVDLPDTDQDFLVDLLDTSGKGRVEFEMVLSLCFPDADFSISNPALRVTGLSKSGGGSGGETGYKEEKRGQGQGNGQMHFLPQLLQGQSGTEFDDVYIDDGLDDVHGSGFIGVANGFNRIDERHRNSISKRAAESEAELAEFAELALEAEALAMQQSALLASGGRSPNLIDFKGGEDTMSMVSIDETRSKEDDSVHNRDGSLLLGVNDRTDRIDRDSRQNHHHHHHHHPNNLHSTSFLPPESGPIKLQRPRTATLSRPMYSEAMYSDNHNRGNGVPPAHLVRRASHGRVSAVIRESSHPSYNEANNEDMSSGNGYDRGDSGVGVVVGGSGGRASPLPRRPVTASARYTHSFVAEPPNNNNNEEEDRQGGSLIKRPASHTTPLTSINRPASGNLQNNSSQRRGSWTPKDSGAEMLGYANAVTGNGNSSMLLLDQDNDENNNDEQDRVFEFFVSEELRKYKSKAKPAIGEETWLRGFIGL